MEETCVSSSWSFLVILISFTWIWYRQNAWEYVLDLFGDWYQQTRPTLPNNYNISLSWLWIHLVTIVSIQTVAFLDFVCGNLVTIASINTHFDFFSNSSVPIVSISFLICVSRYGKLNQALSTSAIRCLCIRELGNPKSEQVDSHMWASALCVSSYLFDRAEFQ